MQPTRWFALLAFAAGMSATGSAAGRVQTPAEAPPVAIDVNLQQSTGQITPIWNWFGYDEGNYTTAENGRQLLSELHDLSPVPVFIRAHHLLTSGDGTPELKWSSTGVYREGPDGRPVYDFRILDGIFDAYARAGVRPMVELGFMPRDLAAQQPGHPRPYQVHFPAGDVLSGASNNPPKDYAKWGNLVQAVVAHLAERYGRDTVLGWSFEVWNEPDIEYWHGTPQEYWRLYDFAAAGARRALPGARVGGPASTGPGAANARDFLDGFLRHVERDRSMADGGTIPLDFISFHVKGQPKVAGDSVEMSLRAELVSAEHGFQVVTAHPGLAQLPIILSEADPEGCAACSSRMNPANNYRNGTLYPAYTAAAYKNLLALKARYRVNLISMLSWSFEFEGTAPFEGYRDLATDGIDKPILNLFRMLGMMEVRQVQATSNGASSLDEILTVGVKEHPDVDVLATSGEHRASVLLWNYADDARTAPASQVTLTLRGVPVGVRRVELSQFRIDDQHSNAYTVWKKMGSPSSLTPEQRTTLEGRAGLELLGSPVWAEVRKGRLVAPLELPRQSVALIVARWE